ncbi:fused MFS/spermidine synthase [Archangium violaceum]|uniref:fused MFS/spermidine synthase n=1 Tax=Archangium violaceum TaxID=83451 RepID=UPI0036DB1AC0
MRLWSARDARYSRGGMKATSRLQLFSLYTFSGIAGLIYEVALHREFARVFGVTAFASATVLAAYMGGIALGARLFGALADRVARPLRLYGALELGIAVYALLTPALTTVLSSVFVRVASGSDPHATGLIVLRLVLALLFALPPTLLMGGTLPAMARAVSKLVGAAEVARATTTLYTLNLLGAFLGSLSATYLLLPNLGLSKTLWLGAAFSALAGALALLLRDGPEAPPRTEDASAPPIANRVLLAAAAWSGFSVFAYEVVWTQLNGLVIGSSAYAFGMMLSLFLLGLMLGSAIISRMKLHSVEWSHIGYVQLSVSVAVLATLPVWDKIPGVFSAVGPHVTTFAGRELVRFLAAALVLLPPALLLGVFFPLLLRVAAANRELGHAVGGMTALNTAGAVLGSLVTGFGVLPFLGSRGTLLLLISAGCVIALFCFRGRPRLMAATVAVMVVGFTLPGWDMLRLTSGENVYFLSQYFQGGKLLYAAESVQSGMTTVVQYSEAPPRKVLLSNGKFQGNNGGEMVAQVRFSQIPLLFEDNFERALLIGVGTGTSVAVLAASPFQHIDAAELSPDILRASREHFREVNKGSLDSPRVQVHYADGRNMLMLSQQLYDLITIEVSSIWIAGEADLYNREFYALVKNHLKPKGLLQQWVQLHHMTPRDLAVILQTVRQELPHVALFYGGRQGQIIASREPIVMDYARVRALSDRLRGTFAANNIPAGDFMMLAGEALLSEQGVDAYIQRYMDSGRPSGFVSTDDNLYLEYSTPRGNVFPLSQQRELLQAIRSVGHSEIPVRGADGPGEAAHVRGARLAGQRDLKAAIAALTEAVSAGASHAEPLRADLERLLIKTGQLQGAPAP